jgi:hypothetical protein
MLDVKRFALAGGILCGVVVFLITLISIGTSGYGAEWLRVVESVYPGFHVTVVGSIVGLFYGFVDGFVVLGVFAWLYNKLEVYVK